VNWLIVLGATAALALVTVAFAVLYSRLVPSADWRHSVAASMATAGTGIVAWLMLAPLVAAQALGPLYFPVAMLAGLSAVVATLSVRSTGAPLRLALVFSAGWSILVFVPVATATFLTGILGIKPVDHGGSLAANIATGAAAAAILLLPGDRHRSQTAGARWPWGLGAGAALLLALGWLGWLVAAEFAVDEVSGTILVNGALGAAGGIGGWLAVQRMSHQTTSLSAVVAGLVSGLAAVSAGAPLLSPVAAVSSGIIAGGVACIFTVRRVAGSRRQQWYLVGAHLMAGAIGIVLIGLLASDSGFLFTGQISLIQDQIASAAVVALYSAVVSALLWICLRKIGRSTGLLPTRT